MAWFRALAAQTLQTDEEPFLAAIADSDGPAAALALVRKRDGTLRGLTAPYTTSFGPAARAASEARLLGRMLGKLVPARLDLDALPATPVNSAFLEGLGASGLVTADYRHFANWYEDIDSIEAYWNRRPKKLRETVRRRSARLDAAGGIFHLLQAPEDLAAGIACYEEVYRGSGKCPEPHPGIIPALIRGLGELGQVRLGLLRLNGQTIAAQLWLVEGRNATIFKLAHRTDFSGYSPGTVLTYRMLSDLVPGLGLARVDFGRGNDFYKRDWLGSCVFRKGVIACNPASLRGLRNIATSVFPTWAVAALHRARAAA
jgi:hypothetical protein